ncbi:MAG TPA: hypothetical protein VIS96_08710 [Terrimicrobiaceae bacterium]
MALVASGLLILSGVTGRAGTLWDIDVFSRYLSGTNSYTDYFDITSDYNPAFQKIDLGKAWFAVSDDQLLDSGEWVEIDLGDQDFLGPLKVDLNLVGGNISGEALLTLDAKGKLKYTVRAAGGDFWALGAKLSVEVNPRSVPEGGATLMLLGMALAGIEALRRTTAGKNRRLA